MGDTDFELLAAWQEGDREAGDRLVARHYERVLRFFEVKAGFVADDLTQQTFLACVNARDTFRHASSFRTFLFGIARRQFLAHRRRSSRQDAAYQRMGGFDSFTTSLSARVARRVEQQVVLQAMARLPDDLLLALQLYYWENMPAKDIACALEIPASTMTSRLARARELLRKEIAELAPPSAMLADIVGDLDAWARSLATIPLTQVTSERGTT